MVPGTSLSHTVAPRVRRPLTDRVSRGLLAPALVAAAPVDLSSALEGSGLVMIETRADAIKAFQPEPPTEPVQPVRRRRAAAVVVDEPLIQVETGRK